MKKRVAITGFALSTPLGLTSEENRQGWWEGRCRFGDIQAYSTAGSSVRYAGQCDAPNIQELPDRKVTKILRRKDVISLLAVKRALHSAGLLAQRHYEPQRCGMFVGAGSTQIGDLTPYFTLVAQCADLQQGTFHSAQFGAEMTTLVNPLVVLQTLMNNSLAYGALTFDLRGVNTNFMDLQVAGLRAVGEGFRAVQNGRADMIVAGGVSGPIEPFQIAAGVRSGFLAKTAQCDDKPHTIIKPYSKDSCGTILSEGSAYVILEDLEKARARGAYVHAEITGWSLHADGLKPFTGHPTSPGLLLALEHCWQEAERSHDKLGFIMGHGCGVATQDEAEAWSYQAFQKQLSAPPAVTSAKGTMGDSTEAQGVISLIIALDALSQKEIPPTWNFSQPTPSAAQLKISASAQPINTLHGMITARSILGVCGALSIQKI